MLRKVVKGLWGLAFYENDPTTPGVSKGVVDCGL